MLSLQICNMNWNDIPYFLALAQAKSLAGAARRLDVNHSTVFRRINALEESLEARLFDRGREGYHLTELGESVLDQAQAAEDAVLGLERMIAGKELKPEGTVRITAPANIAHHYIAPLLPEFGAAYPEIRVDLSVSDQDLDLARREADMAVRATTSPPDYLIGRKVADLEWHLYVSNTEFEQDGCAKNIGEMDQFSLLGADHQLMRLQVFQWLDKQHGANVQHRASDLATMAAMATHSLGLALLPSDQIQPELTRLFSVCPEASAGLWLLTHPDLRRTARVKALFRFLVRKFETDQRLHSV